MINSSKTPTVKAELLRNRTKEWFLKDTNFDDTVFSTRACIISSKSYKINK